MHRFVMFLAILFFLEIIHKQDEFQTVCASAVVVVCVGFDDKTITGFEFGRFGKFYRIITNLTVIFADINFARATYNQIVMITSGIRPAVVFVRCDFSPYESAVFATISINIAFHTFAFDKIVIPPIPSFSPENRFDSCSYNVPPPLPILYHKITD